MGKTYVLSMISYPSVMRKFGIDFARLLPIYISLDTISKSSIPTQLLNLFVERIKQGLNETGASIAPEQVQPQESSDPYRAMEWLLESQNRQIILLLDEFEALAHNPNFQEDFYGNLRHWGNSYQPSLAFVTSSRTPLTELLDPTKRGFVTSPFFNIFMNMYLPLFSQEEAHQLINHGMQGMPISFRPNEVAYLMEVAGTHPFLLQVASYFLFQAYSYGLSQEARQKYLYQYFYQEAAPHFSYVWELAKDEQKIGLTVLALLSKQEKSDTYGVSMHQLQQYMGETEQTLDTLMYRGLVTSEDDKYRLFSSTFGSWIAREIRASLTEPREYETWLKSREAQRGIMKLSKHLVDEIRTEVLPQIAVKYRELVIAWLSDPRTISSVIALLRSSIS